ncbi:uncharacterized protein V1510DRAFT_420609 [Dipodascopsis tothii]|uniref:uncharacterized protein n=1 Tax=Dipodascopsis tothii TaxID=44089 RepID=UPI0034D01DB7
MSPFSSSSSLANGQTGGGHLDSDNEDEPSPAIEFAARNDFQAELFDFDTLSVASVINQPKRLSQEDIDVPKNKERLEWQAMLSSVLTGEVVRSEKRKLQTNETSQKQPEDERWLQIRLDLWMEIRAKVCGRSLAAQRRVIQTLRQSADKVIEDVLAFEVLPADRCDKTADTQIAEVLGRIKDVESFWLSNQAMHRDKPATASPEFVTRSEALVAWVTVTDSLRDQISALKLWIGNDALDLTRAPERQLTEGIADGVSFVERIFKESNMEEIFKSKVLATLHPLIMKTKMTAIHYRVTFEQMRLPSFIDDLVTLLMFPTKLIQEIISTRLSFARKLENTSLMMIDQMLDMFKTSMRLAIEIKTDFKSLSTPEPGWELNATIDEDFDYVFLQGLQFYLEQLHKKLLGGLRVRRIFKSFREAELLEADWNFLKGLGTYIDGADVEVAEQMSALTSKLVGRLVTYFERQLRGPHGELTSLDHYGHQEQPTRRHHRHTNSGSLSNDSGSDTGLPSAADGHREHYRPTAAVLERWYSGTIEHVRGFHRKFLRFSRILENHFENACEFSVEADHFGPVVEMLRTTGHFLVYTASVERDGIYIFADPSLYNNLNKIHDIMRACVNSDGQEVASSSSYLLFLSPPEPIQWHGKIMNKDVPESQLDIKPGRIRLVAEGTMAHLQLARESFLYAVDRRYVELVVEQRANFPRVDKELNRIRKTFYKFAMLIINGAASIRAQCKGIGCQDMVNQYFIFAREAGQRAIRYQDPQRRSACALKLAHLGIEWVSFVCDDCVASDKKTFQWSVNALEYVMLMTRGANILSISDEEFHKLRVKVAGCVTILASHFDVMGARSSLAAQLEQKKLLDEDKLSNTLFSASLSQLSAHSEQSSIDHTRGEWLEKLKTIEETRRLRQEEQRAVGKVLDDGNSETQYLMFLTSSLSNVSIRWQQGRFIGGGTFGSVYAAVNLDNGDLMAVKEIRLQDTQSIRGIVKQIKDEMTVLEMLSHPNIVQYYGVEVHREKVFIFMEYCQGGSLAALLEHGRIEDETVSQVYTLQMLEGLAYLHQSGIVHRDIKPANILLDHLGVIKFVDFGAAKVIAQKGKTRAVGSSAAAAQRSVAANLSSITGTPMYMSPEAITGAQSGRHGSIDIWSLGCCVLEMATGKRPWNNLDNEWAIMYHIAGGYLPTPPSADQLSDLGQQFLRRCFERDPFLRASAVELLDDPWIRAIKMDTIDVQTPSTESEISVG